MDRFDLILKGGAVMTPNGLEKLDIAVRNGKVAEFGEFGNGSAEVVFEATRLTILPGVIDTQVHFREPGLSHKEDIESGSAGAALGGVTGFFDMPNTNPSTLFEEDLADKLQRAKGRSWCDHAFFIGAAEENLDQLESLERLPGCAGVKIFMGSSTGSLLVADDDLLRSVLQKGMRRVAIHAEDEPRLRERLSLVGDGADVSMHPEWRDVECALRATSRVLTLAREVGRRIHALHISTAEEMALLSQHRDIASVEALVNHLSLWAPDCYQRLGTFAQMNPPIRESRHRDALWKAVRDGIVDCIGSDHAPHTREEKGRPYPKSPSGMPGVQTLLPMMLNHMAEGRLTLQRLVDLTSAGPARLYGIAGKGRIAVGYDADFSVVDLKAEKIIDNSWIRSKVGWTPFDGVKVKGWPVATIVRGSIVMRDGQLQGTPLGAPMRFLECL